MSLVIKSACSSPLYLILFLIKSSHVTAANALNPEESVLGDQLKNDELYLE